MRRCDRRGQAGFTLVELTVALVAGLIVALGIVALSKEATTTFHEEVRSAAAEATLRTAVDRLRGDLQRAGYMSTANIRHDPLIARAPGVNQIANVNPAQVGLLRLAGVHLISGGSAAQAPKSADQVPALSPDAIEIGGNMTCADQFSIATVTAQGGGCTRITLAANSPALYRVLAMGTTPAAQAQELNNLFQPYPSATNQFAVRLLDGMGRSQYFATCAETPAAGFTGNVAWVDIDTSVTAVLAPTDTKGQGGLTATPEQSWINPVQLVRWEITNAPPAQYQTLERLPLTGAQDPAKYDLVRSYVDMTTGLVIPQTTEVVAEYAVDLDFALSVENGNAGAPQMLTYSFDDPADNQPWADNISTVVTTKPQMVRIVRVRVATRAAQADRTINVALQNYAVGANGTQAFLYRYCLVTPCDTQDSTLRWARARTMTTEVALPNQSGAFFL